MDSGHLVSRPLDCPSLGGNPTTAANPSGLFPLCRLQGLNPADTSYHALGGAFVDRVPISWLGDNEEAASRQGCPLGRCGTPPCEEPSIY